MSAPTASVLLARYVGDMITEIESDLARHGRENGYGGPYGNLSCRVEFSADTSEPFHVFITEDLRTFQGDGPDAGAALMAANGRRQAFWERRAKGTVNDTRLF